ncbi:MAG: FtsW/RodA/SpoVE family cell cycle protein [Candidatus Levybacteria bacterium]|nr:FtsW/RodA/SpoVE family cell cycle protein [Candidatus Levybacteria bacterium]
MRGGIFNIEWSLLIPVFILVLLSLAALFSINIVYFKSQIGYLIVSLAAFVFFSNVNWRILEHYSVPIYIFSLICLVIVLILGIESRGAVRWMDIFGLRIQFSEILKPFLAVSFSSYLSTLKIKNFKSLIAGLLLVFPIGFLVYLQPDLGNALIYFIVVIFTLIVFGYPLIWFFLGSLFTAVSLPLSMNFLHGYQKQRLLTFFNPGSDPLGSSYNAIQSVMSVGSGMFFGKGLGEGTQSMLRFLPERHTDFIFAALSEQFGFVGSIVVLGSFAFLLYKIYLIYDNSDEKFCKIFSACAFSLILVQVFVNIGMNIGVVPIVGITLPFVSYGGSSILSSFILLGFLSSVSRNFRNKDTLEIR